jgi:hypothetical protein
VRALKEEKKRLARQQAWWKVLYPSTQQMQVQKQVQVQVQKQTRAQTVQEQQQQDWGHGQQRTDSSYQCTSRRDPANVCIFRRQCS